MGGGGVWKEGKPDGSFSRYFMLFCGSTFFLFSSKFFFCKIILEFCLYEEFTCSFLSCAQRGEWPGGRFLNIMRCLFHLFIQSFINSDNLISRLFALVAASSRGVALSAQAVRRHTDLTKSDVLRYHLWGALLINMFHRESALVVSQISYSIHKIVQAPLWCVLYLLWKDIQDEAATESVQSRQAPGHCRELLFLQKRSACFWWCQS